MKLKILFRIGSLLQTISKHRKPILFGEKGRKDEFKLVYFSGLNGLDYLNASLDSIGVSWKMLPDVVIISDGSSIVEMRKKIRPWPGHVEVIDWSTCAAYFKSKGNFNLARYAENELWGKKFVSILYCFEHFKTLYSDTDVLWFNEPRLANDPAPFMCMSSDIEQCFSEPMFAALGEDLADCPALNAGVIYGHGDFSAYGKWQEMCEFLAERPDNRTEQTGFAILANTFGSIWSLNDIVLATDDIQKIQPVRKMNGVSAFARHYVNTKWWLFWRDYFLYVNTKAKAR